MVNLIVNAFLLAILLGILYGIYRIPPVRRFARMMYYLHFDLILALLFGLFVAFVMVKIILPRF